MQNEQYTSIGRFVKAHGVKGLLIAELDSGDGNWPDTHLIYIQDPFFGFKPLRVQNTTHRANKSGYTFFVQLEGISNRQESEPLVHSKVFIDSHIATQFLAESDDLDSFVGYMIEDENGQIRAKVTDSYFNGDHDLLLVEDLENNSQSFWYPLVEEYVESIDDVKRQIIVTDYQQFYDLNAD